MTLSTATDVVIVAGNTAYPEYLDYQAYVGHPNRPFRGSVQRMAFYKAGAIQREVPRVLDVRQSVTFERDYVKRLYDTGESSDRDIADLIQVLLEETSRPAGGVFDVVVLSAPDDPETFVLSSPIINTKIGPSGKPVPITMGQYRYVASEALKSQPTTTDELGL